MAFNPTTIFSDISAFADFLNLFGNNSDVIGVFNSDLQQVFAEARPLKADIRETSQVMKHPVEMGTVIADNHIINPIEINIPFFISSSNYNAMYGQIKRAYYAATVFSIQARTGFYPNMIIADMPHEETTEMADAIILNVHFVEVLFVVPTSVSSATLPANFSPQNEVNSNTVQAGVKSPMGVSPSNSSAASSTIMPGL
jgi:hypothetical protein